MKKLFLTLLASTFVGYAEDWSTWRGVNQNGKTTEKVASTSTLSKQVWTKDVHEGYPAVSVYQGKVLTAGNKNGSTTIFCLDAKTGAEIWTFKYPSPYVKSYPGPRATPVTDGKMVYMFSRYGDLYAVDFKTGKKVWHQDLDKDHDADNIRWGFSGTVGLKGNNVFVNAGVSGMAFNKTTGKPIWKNSGGRCGYATPVFFTHNKVDLVAIMGEKKFYIVNEKSGSIVADYDWVTSYNINATDPIITDQGNKIFISSAYKHGGALLNFDGKKLTKVWENKNLSSQFSTPVLIDGILYGSNGNTGKGKLVAVDHKTGELKWTSKKKFGSPLVVDDKILYLDERGNLMLIKPNPEKLEVLVENRIIKKGKCWTMPVVVDGLIYCRNDRGTLVVIDANK